MTRTFRKIKTHPPSPKDNDDNEETFVTNQNCTPQPAVIYAMKNYIVSEIDGWHDETLRDSEMSSNTKTICDGQVQLSK